jgi:hypothetical protein
MELWGFVVYLVLGRHVVHNRIARSILSLGVMLFFPLPH